MANLIFFFFNDTATTEIYTLSLHDALPISTARISPSRRTMPPRCPSSTSDSARSTTGRGDRKSTRLNSSHDQISYAVFCLKKKNKTLHTSSPISKIVFCVERRVSPREH